MADDSQPQTEAGAQAAADKAAARERIAAQAATDQKEAAERAAAAEKRRAQTAAARQARAEGAGKPRSDAFAQAVTEQAPAVDERAAEAQGCEGCREFQEQTLARLAAVETQARAIGKLIATALIAGAVIYVLRGREVAQAEQIEG